jgi:hypothetical protein
MSSAVARSAVPLACVTRASMTSPLRFSVIRWPIWQSFASLPAALRNNRASGSVVEECVSFARLRRTEDDFRQLVVDHRGVYF